MLQVVIPMAGLGSRFTQYGFNKNKYLLPINIHCDTMIEHAIISLQVNIPCTYIFIIREENIDIELRNILQSICTKHNLNYQIHSISSMTEGPADTVSKAIHLLNLEEPLLVSNSDQVLDWNFNKFMNICQNYQGCVLTYNPPYTLSIGDTDKHSFIKLDNKNNITQVAEKIVLSNNALVGVHYYQKTKYFKEAFEYMKNHNIKAPNGEYYLSLTYQAMIENNMSVGYYPLEQDLGVFSPTGEPFDYFNYLYSKGGYINDTQPLQCPHTLLQNEHVHISYQFAPANTFILNPGLILLLNNYTITNSDINTETDIYYISIQYPTNLPKQTWNLSSFTRGWFIGNFQPSIIQTELFEIGLLTHLKDEKWPFHYHQYATEINVLLQGNMIINNNNIPTRNIFTIHKNQIACPIFLDNCKVLCIKIPSITNDKLCI